ncbi:amino acid ABC transporter substrate-binding protein [Candidatus Entotheonella palauensis]|uniref:amino acid ABC transporter substrate-binding protein n=1 Tax=Candidatus Entotheonella palauensis TaxID=93172 RepID=UPI0015C4AFF5|nr:amino acid ABC transporter substrate-binding protein [Candidatus Entotheonella palauensis]
MLKKIFTLTLALVTTFLTGLGAMTAVQAATGDTLKAIKDRGALLCTGHNGTYLGFAEVDDKGAWKGFDIELCKALATAVLGAPDKLKIIPISWAQRFPSIQSGDIDVIIKVTGWTMGRDTELGLQFSRPYFLGSTQLMAHKEIGAKSAKDLDGATVCGSAGTSTERIAADYLSNLGVKFDMVTFEKTEEMRSAYFAGRCDAFAGWGPNLAIVRMKAPAPDKHIILPDVMAVEPESAAMRQGDDNWVDILNWLFSALLIAEQYGITSANVDEHRDKASNPTIERLLGKTPGIGDRLGLSNDWAYKVIKHVGNYKEIYDRTLGAGSPYKLARGPNALITDGGVMYPLILD